MAGGKGQRAHRESSRSGTYRGLEVVFQGQRRACLFKEPIMSVRAQDLPRLLGPTPTG